MEVDGLVESGIVGRRAEHLEQMEVQGDDVLGS